MFGRSFQLIFVACLSSVQLAPSPDIWSSVGDTLSGAVQQVGSGLNQAGSAISDTYTNAVKPAFDSAGAAIVDTANNVVKPAFDSAGKAISEYGFNYYECMRLAGSDVNEMGKCQIRNNANENCPAGIEENIAICPAFSVGDNNLGTEQFLQENEHTENTCRESCEKLYPVNGTRTAVGVTERVDQKYPKSGKAKCWCEFGCASLDATQTNYKTCRFA